MAVQRGRGGLILRAALAFSSAALWLTAPATAEGAGLYVADRGVRPLGRAGAFVAGADDLGAIAYNPAGIFEAGGQILVDGSWVNFESEYTRRSLLRQTDPNTGETTGEFIKTYRTVDGTTPVLPIPTLAASYQLDKEWVVAAGVWAPYAGLMTYPSDVPGASGPEPAPQRYSLLTLEGSLLALVGVSAAYAPMKTLRLGATLGLMTGIMKGAVNVSGCVPERFFCAPEDPEWDVLAELSGGPIFAPTGQVGAIYIPNREWRFGLSVQLPTWVRSAATIRTRLPAAPVFEQASQKGDGANLNFELPWSVRVGAEARIVRDLRVELAFQYEGWSMHDSLEVDPDGISLRNIVGFPDSYYLPSVTLPRGFQDAVSVRLGGEYALTVLGKKLSARGGVSYESSAIPAEYLSVTTMDSNKITTALGVSLHLGALRLDATYAHVFGFDVTVDPREARAPQVSPLKANPPENPNYINGGDYSHRSNIIGLGLAYTYGQPAADP
jgi:long-chain fatty acid transport protein